MTLALIAGGIVASFAAGTKYGPAAEKRAVATGIALLTEAKLKVGAAISRAKATAQADVARLEDIAKKYL